MTLRAIAAAVALTALLAAVPGSAFAAKAPKVSLSSSAQLPRPLPYPYDPKADAQAEVAAAAARAKAAHKLLLIDLGGNWCGDCRMLAGVMRLPEVKSFLDAHYEIVTVDVDRLDRNMDIPLRYGIGPDDLIGVPALLIIDETGALRNRHELITVTDKRHTRPQQMADWLAKWVK
ncbi:MULTISPECIES: TlpA family protein disulfide reductase [unclassified Caulobacter]|uniref:TlpA family protein disulfide reductase n=1 Tax=unclassified Caulobacter TaxID=2648921 RepID=UPI000D3CFDC8|nr:MULTISPECIES: thioredoxin family protein [unclassified Caulobacter]PTS88164.1 thiol reductase thioredoxin [Caulobacter sp. HMWF009]PTT06969.1 thiol reductase thioredoxin [Caulobacter sp. HMWF025]